MPLFDGYELLRFRTSVVGRRANDLAVAALFQNMSGPAGGARDDEQGREQVDGDAHLVIGYGTEPVEVGKHPLGLKHDALNARGNIKKGASAGRFGEFACDILDDFTAGIADGVDGVAEADDDLALGDAAADVQLGFVGRGVTILDLERYFISAAVLGTLERPDGAGDAGVEVRTGAGDDARGKRGSIEFVFRVKDERNLHGRNPLGGRLFSVQQVEEVRSNGVGAELDLNAPTVARVVVPVKQHGTETGEQGVSDGAGALFVVIDGLGKQAAEHGHAGAEYIHGVRR